MRKISSVSKHSGYKTGQEFLAQTKLGGSSLPQLLDLARAGGDFCIVGPQHGGHRLLSQGVLGDHAAEWSSACSMAPRTVGLGSPAAGLGSPGKRQDPTPHPGLFFLPQAPTTCSPPAPGQATPGPRQNLGPWGAGWGRGQDGGLGAGCTEGLGGMRFRGARRWHRTGLVPGPAAAWSGRAQRAARGLPRAGCAPPARRGRDLGFPSAARKEASAAAHVAASHTQFVFLFIYFFMCLLFLQLENRWV